MGGTLFVLPFILALTTGLTLVEVLEEENCMTFLECLPTDILNKIDQIKVTIPTVSHSSYDSSFRGFTVDLSY